MTFLSRAAVVAVAALAQGTTALNPQWGTVLPDDQARSFARERLCSRPAPGPADSTWTPDAETIRRLESILANELQAAIDLSSESRKGRKAAEYYRQYAPLVIAGKRIVYVNGLHRSTVERQRKFNWKATAWEACDGGVLFFGTEYDVETGRISKIIFNGGGRGAVSADRRDALPEDLTGLIDKASLVGRIYSWCAAADGFAVATVNAPTPGYVVLFVDGRVQTLAAYKGGPDLACYSRREAEKLHASITQSETIHGGVTPKWNTPVICGFVEDTMAVCWQYSSTARVFVEIGGWTT